MHYELWCKTQDKRECLNEIERQTDEILSPREISSFRYCTSVKKIKQHLHENVIIVIHILQIMNIVNIFLFNSILLPCNDSTLLKTNVMVAGNVEH